MCRGEGVAMALYCSSVLDVFCACAFSFLMTAVAACWRYMSKIGGYVQRVRSIVSAFFIVWNLRLNGSCEQFKL